MGRDTQFMYKSNIEKVMISKIALKWIAKFLENLFAPQKER